MLSRRLGRRDVCVFLGLLSLMFVAYLYVFHWNSEVKKRHRLNQDFPTNYVYKKKLPSGEIDDDMAPELTALNVTQADISSDMNLKKLENNFYRYIEQKAVKCDKNDRYGNQHEGGWNVCQSPPFTLKEPCLVYSFGIGSDWRFEDDIYDRHSCKVMMFDPSINKREHMRMDLMWFQPIGLGSGRMLTNKAWRVKTFKQHLMDEGHWKMAVDYLKFDIEYMEWEVLQTMLADGSLSNVKQLGFEIHMVPVNEHKPSRPKITRPDFIMMYRILRSLEHRGFMKFDFRMNPFCMYNSSYTGKSRSWCYDQHYVNRKFIKKKQWKSEPPG